MLFTIWFANSLFFTIVLYLIFQGHMNQFYELVPKDGIFPLLTIPALLVSAVAFVAVFGIIVIGIMSLFISNQIAGPLHRTKMSMNRMIAGDLAFDLQFRESDFLIDFPPVFNAMLDSLRQRSASEIEDLKAIESASSNDEVVALARKNEREQRNASRDRRRGQCERRERTGSCFRGGTLNIEEYRGIPRNIENTLGREGRFVV